MKKRQKEKRNEATERAIFIDFQGPFHPRTRQNIVRRVRLVSGLGISWQINSTRHPSPLAPSTKFIPDYSYYSYYCYFTGLFTILNEKEKNREEK